MRVLLVGQPNSGKSTFFNAVAGYRSLTSNFPGTTVEYTRGRARVAGEVFEVIDLPGIYSLAPTNPAEACTREFLLGEDWDVLVNVIDTSQLARSLGLTLELLDLEAPVVISLNMMDEATRKGISVDSAALRAALGVPVVEAIASRGQGIVETFGAAIDLGRGGSAQHSKPYIYAPQLEPVVQELAKDLGESGRHDSLATPAGSPGDLPLVGPQTADYGEAAGERRALSSVRTPTNVLLAPRGPTGPVLAIRNPRFEALQLLQADPQAPRKPMPAARHSVETTQAAIIQLTGQPAEAAISSARHAAALALFERVAKVARPRPDWREQVDRLLMHPMLGYFFLALIFLGFFRLVFDFGQMGERHILAFFDQVIAFLSQRLDPVGLAFATAKGALLGTAGAVAIVLPYLIPFLIGLSILEDVGYLARVGYLMDAVMHRLGLHGTATIPVLLGYGCSVPAVMATRILASRRDRFVAAFLAVLVPCSARMTVIFALVGFYLGASWALAIYALNLAVVVLAGNVLAKLWPEIAPGMLMEVPPYHRPSARVVVLKTWWRLREFVVVAVPLLIVGSAVLGLVDFFGWERVINSALSPLTALLGLPSAVGLTLIFGILRKELSLLMLMQALGTTDVISVMTAAQVVVFTVFVTFYLPCLAALASMLREVGKKLTIAAAGALLLLAIVISLAARGILHFFM